jgi:hypothetical protein
MIVRVTLAPFKMGSLLFVSLHLNKITKPPLWGGKGPYKVCRATDDDHHDHDIFESLHDRWSICWPSKKYQLLRHYPALWVCGFVLHLTTLSIAQTISRRMLKAKAVPLHAMGALGGRRYSSYSFLTSVLNGVSGQRHASAAL